MCAKNNLHQPLIIKKNMQPIKFEKNDYSVVFPTYILDKLYEMTLIAESLNVEINALLFVKDGVVKEIFYPSASKIIVIDTLLPFEIKANVRAYFDETGDAINVLREKSYDLHRAEVDVNQGRKNLNALKKILLKYYTWFSYEKQDGTRQNIYPETINSIIAVNESVISIIKHLKDMDAYASEWFSSKMLQPFKIENGKFIRLVDSRIQPNFKSDEIIKIHNHPVGIPSPPSCWIRNGEISGDVCEIFEGNTCGNLLSRGAGKWELVLFKENDASNLQKYIKLFVDFWGWTRDRGDVAKDIRKVALTYSVIST
jgi:hypothetical protein